MKPKEDEAQVDVPVPDNNSDIFTGLAITGVLAVAGFYIYNNFIKRDGEEDYEEQEIPARIAEPQQPLIVYEDRFPDFYPYKSFANPARRPYYGGTPIPIPIESIYVPPPTLAYWNPAYPNTDNRK